MRKQILLLFIFSTVVLCGQNFLPPGAYTSQNKKAIKLFKSAEKAMAEGKVADAEKFSLKALKTDSLFAEPNTMLGYILIDQGKLEEAIIYLEKSVRLAGNFFPNNFYQLAEIYFYTGKYAQALQHFNRFLSFPRIHPEVKTKAEFLKSCSEFGVSALANPRPYSPVNLGSSVNTIHDEYFPTVTADNATFYFTRKLEDKNSCSNTEGQEDFYFSKRDSKNAWGPVQPFREINSSCNEGAPNISADGQFLFYTACGDVNNDYGPGKEKGYGSCDIFFTEKTNGKWRKPVNLGRPVNTEKWETQPSFSSDGKTLYFVRGIQGRGQRSGDIYYAVIGNDGKFGEPVKLGANINTEMSEESVFIHPDNMTLYFSSNGRIGLGGMDIYMSKRQPNGEWGPAVNLGYPINTCKDENSLLVDPSGKLAYFASNREGGLGRLDIYQFELPEEFMPEKITYAKGMVYDSLDRKPLAAQVELIDLETGKNMLQYYTGASGEFLFTLTANKNYMANVSRPGYLFYSERFRMKEQKTDYDHPFLLNIPLLPIDTGKSTVLKNVYFDVDRAELRAESFPELDKLVLFMRQNADLTIEISGHTDNTGDKAANLLLSKNRAQSVVDYLTKAGLNSKRLLAVGWGEAKPIAPNDSEYNKQLNRRTEYRIIGTKKGMMKTIPSSQNQNSKKNEKK